MVYKLSKEIDLLTREYNVSQKWIKWKDSVWKEPESSNNEFSNYDLFYGSIIKRQEYSVLTQNWFSEKNKPPEDWMVISIV